MGISVRIAVLSGALLLAGALAGPLTALTAQEKKENPLFSEEMQRQMQELREMDPTAPREAEQQRPEITPDSRVLQRMRDLQRAGSGALLREYEKDRDVQSYFEDPFARLRADAFDLQTALGEESPVDSSGRDFRRTGESSPSSLRAEEEDPRGSPQGADGLPDSRTAVRRMLAFDSREIRAEEILGEQEAARIRGPELRLSGMEENGRILFGGNESANPFFKNLRTQEEPAPATGWNPGSDNPFSTARAPGREQPWTPATDALSLRREEEARRLGAGLSPDARAALSAVEAPRMGGVAENPYIRAMREMNGRMAEQPTLTRPVESLEEEPPPRYWKPPEDREKTLFPQMHRVGDGR